MKKLCIGTSGWFYDEWNGVFYPEDVSTENRLPFYSQHFDTVEINNTFYHMPSLSSVEAWQAKVSKNFTFSVKLSRYITHLKRLKDCEESLNFFMDRMASLQKKLGPILIQLPPSFKQDLPRLNEFLSYAPRGHLYVVEFRHPSWYEEEVYKLLRKHSVALCITDLKGKLSAPEVTSNFTYIRLHGPRSAYSGEYGTRRLKVWQERIEQWRAKKLSVYCYFDNDAKGAAVKDAQNLKKLCKEE